MFSPLAGLILLLTLVFPALHASYENAEDELDPQSLIQIQAMIHRGSEAGFHQGDHPEEKGPFLALYLRNRPGWHTYWSNPGDSGTPIHLFIQQGQQLTPLSLWRESPPKIFKEAGNLQVYGHQGDYAQFYQLPKKFIKQKAPLKIKVDVLICKKICLPVTKTLHAPGGGELFSEGERISMRESLPLIDSSPDLNIKMLLNGSQLSLLSTWPHTIPNKKQMIIPYTQDVLNFGKEQRMDSGQTTSSLPLEWLGEYNDPPVSKPTGGSLSSPISLKLLFFHPERNGYVIVERTLSEVLVQSRPMAETKLSQKTFDSSPVKDLQNSSLLWMLFLAFVGGFILNFMPCVLPVIGIKLFGLLRAREEQGQSLMRHTIPYSLGVMVSFLALAVVVHLFKVTGHHIGWGMQMQSPTFLIVISLFVFLFICNLFDLFQFSMPGAQFFHEKLGGPPGQSSSFIYDFLSGILATVLATPCSAPFLGTAVSFALTSSVPHVYLIFFALGLGLSSPFWLAGFFPSAIQILPRPGIWMEHFKKLLALLLIFTLIWLQGILLKIAPIFTVQLLHITLAFLFFALYLGRAGKSWRILFLILALLGCLKSFHSLNPDKSHSQEIQNLQTQSGALSWHPWSLEKMHELKKAEQVFFIDFTADWCLTCKVNEKTVLQTEDFRNLVAEHHMTLLLGDWTKADPAITDFLKTQGKVGVPAYFLYNSQGDFVDLGELLTLEKIRDNL